MRKTQKISDLEATIAFSEFDFYQRYQQSFSTGAKAQTNRNARIETQPASSSQ